MRDRGGLGKGEDFENGEINKDLGKYTEAERKGRHR